MKKNIEERVFDLETLITITSGISFTTLEKTIDFLVFISSNCKEITLADSIKKSKKYILDIYPELEGVGAYQNLKTFSQKQSYLEEQKEIFGNEFKLEPMKSTNTKKLRKK